MQNVHVTEESDVADSPEVGSERLDFGIEGFRRRIGEPPSEIVYYCGVVVLESLAQCKNRLKC